MTDRRTLLCDMQIQQHVYGREPTSVQCSDAAFWVAAPVDISKPVRKLCIPHLSGVLVFGTHIVRVLTDEERTTNVE